MKTELTDNGLGQTICAVRSTGTTTYALVWGAAVSMTDMCMEYTDSENSGVETVMTDGNGLNIHPHKGGITIESAGEGHLAIVSAQGGRCS